MKVQFLPLLILGASALRLYHQSNGPVVKTIGEKTPIWVYFDKSPGHDYTGSASLFGNLTFEAMEQRIDPDEFELKIVNAENVKEYLPEVPKEFFRLYDGAKSDFLRTSLIAKHGGIYMDADIMLHEDFHDLWSELDKQQSETVTYLSPGQSCNRQFTTNFMMGHKGNKMNTKWTDDITKALRTRCPSDDDNKNDVCCYTKDGEMRKQCHIPWGRISLPQERGMQYTPSTGVYSLAQITPGKSRKLSVACIGADRGFGIDDDTGRMLWQTLAENEKDGKGKDACWMDGANLVCDNGKKMRNFLKRTGYHLYTQINYQQRQMDRQQLLFGSNHTVARMLFRHLLLGEDTFDAPKDGKCFHKQTFAEKMDNILKPQVDHMTFIHIPRTGGTAVEACTKDDPDEKWGVQDPNLHGLYHFEHEQQKGACYKQHVPPTFMKKDSPYKNKNTFCVVRDPYSRILSQFRFELTFYKTPTECNAKQLNEMIKMRLNEHKAGKQHTADCHYMAQTKYVYASGHSGDDTHRTCMNVLKYENLGQSFNKLLLDHHYPYHFDKAKSGMTVNEKCKMTTADIDMESRKLIEEVYAEDFKNFGYTHLQ